MSITDRESHTPEEVRAADAAASGSLQSGSAEPALRVLLVEDNPDDVLLLRRSLSRSTSPSFEIVHAATLSEAVHHLAAGAYDIVLLDLMLPDSSGLDTLDALLHDAPASLPIVVLSGLADEQTSIQALQHGAQDYLLKDELSSNLLSRAIRYAVERWRVRRQIQAQNQVLTTILEGIPIGIALLDRDTRFVDVNATYARLVGVERSALVGRSLYDVLPRGRARQLVYERALGGEEINEGNYPYKVPGTREQRYYDIQYRPLRDPSGAVTGLLTTAIDVTERNRLEQQKDDFIAVASHELKTPITTIKGYAQMGVRAAENAGDVRLARMLRIINDQSDRLTRLVNELLDVSRMQSGALALNQELFNLGALVESVVGNLELTSPHFTFSARLPELPALVNGDRHRIEQVVVNLLENAIKYSGKSNRVDIDVAVTLHSAPGAEEGEPGTPSEVITTVRDYGIGIPAPQLSQVFERFFRGHNVREHHVGLGLGLFISQSIVARHGGRIWVASTEGEGSAFHFSLPLAEGQS